MVVVLMVGAFAFGALAGGLGALMLARSNRRRIDRLERRVRSLGVVDTVIRHAVTRPRRFELGGIRHFELIEGAQPAPDLPSGLVRRKRRT